MNRERRMIEFYYNRSFTNQRIFEKFVSTKIIVTSISEADQKIFYPSGSFFSNFVAADYHNLTGPNDSQVV